MDNLARFYKQPYVEAMNFALVGNNRAALDIVWDMRLKPDLGLYRRALVNLLLAAIAPQDKLKYAEESLDLVDIIRKERDGYDSEQLRNIESTAQDIVNKSKISDKKATVDPTGGFLSSDPIESPTKLSSPMKKIHIQSQIDSTKTEGLFAGQEAEAASDEDDEGEVLYTYESTPTIDKPRPGALFGERMEGIEGYLRDPYLAPRTTTDAAQSPARDISKMPPSPPLPPSPKHSSSP